MARLTLNKYTGDPALNGFRLTLTSGTPVTTADVTGATTIYYTPYKGDRIVLYDGTNWQLYQSPEVSLAVGTLADASNYDIWVRDVNGTLTLDFSTVWTNDTTRADAIATTNGVTHKSGDQTRRLAGTIRTTSTTTCEDSAAKRFCANMDNRVERAMRVVDSTDSWSYTTTAWREANGATTNRLQYVASTARHSVAANLLSLASASSGSAYPLVGIGVDSTTAISGINTRNAQATGTYTGVGMAQYVGAESAGYHYLSRLEYGDANMTWYGDAGAPAQYQTGITGTVWN